MNKLTNRIYIETPIDKTDGLEPNAYDTKRRSGDATVHSRNIYNPAEFGNSFGGWFVYNPPGTTYLRPLPEGTRILHPGEVAVNEDELMKLSDFLRTAVEHKCSLSFIDVEVNKFIITKLAQMGE